MNAFHEEPVSKRYGLNVLCLRLFSECYRTCRLPNQNFICTLRLPILRYTPYASYPSWLGHPGMLMFGEEYLFVSVSPTSCYFISSGQILLITPFLNSLLNNLGLCSVSFMWEMKFCAHTEQINIQFCVFSSMFEIDGKTKYSELHGSKHSGNLVLLFFFLWFRF
jgi:hypothetical protein